MQNDQLQIPAPAVVLDLLMSWASRIEELADFLEEPRWLGAASRKDYASGIQERAQCMIDLLRALSERELPHQDTNQ